MASGIRDRIGKVWGGLGGEGQAQLIGGGIGALGGMISSGEDRSDALARDAYARQLAAFNALQQNPYSQAMALQRANMLRGFLEGKGEDASAISPEALAAAQGQWEGERQGVRGTGFHPEDQQKKGGGFWSKLGKIGLGIGSVALPMVTGGLSLPVQAAIGAGMGAAGGALGGGGASGAAKGAALGAGGGLLGGWLRGQPKELTMASNTLTNTGGMQNVAPGGRAPISRGLPSPGHPNLFPPDIQTPRSSSYMPSAGGVDSIASALVDAHQGNRGGKPPAFMPPSNLGQPDLYETLPGGPPPGARSSIRGGPMPRWTGGLPEGMEFTPVSPPSPPDRSREMPQTARDATVYPSGWGQGPTRADNPATYSSGQPRVYGDTSRGLTEGNQFTPVSPPPPFDLSQVPSPPVQGLVPKIQGRSALPPPPPWSLSQEAGITPSRSLMGRPPVVSPHHFTPGAWTGDWQPPWQGSPQSPLPARVNQDRPWPESTYPGPALGQWRARGTAQPDEAGMQPRTELPIGSDFGTMGGQVGSTRDPRVPAGVTMSPMQMYLNTLTPADKAAFLQRRADQLAQEGRR